MAFAPSPSVPVTGPEPCGSAPIGASSAAGGLTGALENYDIVRFQSLFALPVSFSTFFAQPSFITPLGDHPFVWKKPRVSKLKRALSNQKRPSHESASSLVARSCRRAHLAANPVRSERSSAVDANPPSCPTRPKHVPIVIPHYVPIVAPTSPCTSSGLSSSRTSTIASSGTPSLSGFPFPNRKSVGEPSSIRSRHVEILIPDWALPIQRFSSSPITLPIEFDGLKTPLSPRWSSRPASMARQTPNTSRTNTIDSQISAPSPSQLYSDTFRNTNGNYASVNSSQTSLHRQETVDGERPPTSSARTPGSGMAASPALMQTAGLGTPTSSTSGLSGLVCNVHRTTGREPHPLVGATTTILGDKLYVFGGRRLSRTRPQLTSDLYELDLIKRHWTKIDAKGDIPPPRYFHSVCGLGDTKLVCYGGMSPASQQTTQTAAVTQGNPTEAQPEVVVMSDIHIYDVITKTWMHVATSDAPQGRYAHCATILPSSAAFSSTTATLAAIRHNPSTTNPNQGSIGVQLEGEGGAEMVVVGGQDSANHYKCVQLAKFKMDGNKYVRKKLWRLQERSGTLIHYGS
jgi:hypothetical protein